MYRNHPKRGLVHWRFYSNVSCVINAIGYIKATTRVRLMQASQLLNYAPSLPARSVRYKRTHPRVADYPRDQPVLDDRCASRSATSLRSAIAASPFLRGQL